MRAARPALLAALWCVLAATQAASVPSCLKAQHHLRTVPAADQCAYATRTPRVALLFLVKGDMPHERLWERWFRSIDSTVYAGCMPRGSAAPAGCTSRAGMNAIARQELFNVYVHSSPDHAGYPQSSVFHGALCCPCCSVRRALEPVCSLCRRELSARSVHSRLSEACRSLFRSLAGYDLKHRVEAKWMDLSPAMFIMIRAAVHNPANAFFVLLSESCVPLYPARAFYLQVIHSQKSRINGVQQALQPSFPCSHTALQNLLKADWTACRRRMRGCAKLWPS